MQMLRLLVFSDQASLISCNSCDRILKSGLSIIKWLKNFGLEPKKTHMALPSYEIAN